MSRWERGVERPRPSREAELQSFLRNDAERRQLCRALAIVRNDVLPSTLVNKDMYVVEMSRSAERHYLERGVERQSVIGRHMASHSRQLGVPGFPELIEESGLASGDAVLLRFVRNTRGRGHVTVWEPVFTEGELSSILCYVSHYFDFPPNEENTLELLEVMPSGDPVNVRLLHKGKRHRFAIQALKAGKG